MDLIRKQIAGEPVNPVKSIFVYIAISLAFSTIVVIGYFFCMYDGDWDRVFKDDDNNNSNNWNFRQSWGQSMNSSYSAH